MGNIMRFTLGAICFCLLVIHYFDREGNGVSALNFFSPKTCDEKDGTCPTKPVGPPSKITPNFYTSGPFLTGASIAAVGVILYIVKRSQRRTKKRVFNRNLDESADPNLDPYDVIQCLRNRLLATETELAEMRSRDDSPVSNADALALVPKWNCGERSVSLKSRGSKSVCSAKSQRSSKEWKVDLTNADYVRKCKYMAKKLKESESNVKLLRAQIAIANDIKADFDDLVEQRGDMGKQIVTLTKEKSEARRKITSLQVEVRTMRKQMDTVNEQNTLLSKHNEQLGTNLKNALRDKKLAKRQFDECNEELLLVRQKLDSIHQEKERLVVRIEDLEKKALKKPETKSGKGKEVGTSTSAVDMKSFERSLLNLERSVEENLRLRKSAESLFSEASSNYGARDEKIATIRRDLERMEEIYRVEVQQGSANEVSYNNSETSVATKEISSNEDFQTTHRHTHGVKDEVSVCCLDSTCSVCSKKNCDKLHRSCSDIRCVLPFSEVDVGKGGGVRSSIRRSPAVEKLADIFGSDEDFSGIGVALRRSKKGDALITRSSPPKRSSNDSPPRDSLTNMLKDFTTSEESLATTESFEMQDIKAPPTRAKNATNTKDASPGRERSSPGRSRLNASYSNPAISTKSGKKSISCYTNASEDGKTTTEMIGCLSQDPELGDEDMIGDQCLAQLSESASYLFGGYRGNL